MLRIGVVGSCSFRDYDLLRSVLDKYPPFVVVSGGAKGADTLAEQYAKEKGYETVIFPAQWNRYGRAAGPIRNKQIVDVAEKVVAFWNGTSRGTAITINMAKKKGIEVVIVPFVPRQTESAVKEDKDGPMQ